VKACGRDSPKPAMRVLVHSLLETVACKGSEQLLNLSSLPTGALEGIVSQANDSKWFIQSLRESAISANSFYWEVDLNFL
jgi:hypothetical protein